jgi:hypothetical protein
VEGGLVNALAMLILKELPIWAEYMLLMDKTFPDVVFDMVQG